MFLLTSMRIVYRAALNWSANGGTRMGAALAYYAVFSIAPLLLIAIYVTGAVFGEDAAKGKVQEQLQSVMGQDIASGVQVFVQSANEQQQTAFWTPILSAIFLVFGALGAFLHVRTSLCTIWKIEPPHGNDWLGMLLDYTLAVAMVFVIATLLLISLVASLVTPVLQRLMAEAPVPIDATWHWIGMGASFLFITLLFAVSYRVLSGGRIAWGYVCYGGVVAAILFTIGKILVGYYILYSGVASMYGAGGSIVVFLVWVYYSSQTLFFGAELIQARRTRHEWLTPTTESRTNI